jgi:DNA-binding response OmpR family regulator
LDSEAAATTAAKELGRVKENPVSLHATHNILVVEDERHIARFLEHIPHKQGFTVESVHDGNDAVQRLQNNSYSAVPLDLGLQGRGGPEVRRYLRMVYRSKGND